MKLALAGFGGVGRQLVMLLAEKAPAWESHYGVRLELVAVATRERVLMEPRGLPLDSMAQLAREGRALGGDADQGGLFRAGAGVLIDATPTNLYTGEPALSLLRTAFDHRMHAVVLSKGALVRAYPELDRRAREAGVALKFSGAVAAALPTADTVHYALAGATVLGFTGILNGTTNFILSFMTESGAGYDEALQEARRRGIAEADPALDVDGHDTAAKICILANAVLRANLGLEDVHVTGIRDLPQAEIAAARARGRVLKLVGEARSGPDGVRARVELKALPAGSLLAGVGGSAKAIVYQTDTMGELALVGGASDPRGAAAAALKDVLNLRNHGPGWPGMTGKKG
ncbi:MAG: homoserine dehydrogenase [Bacillota bacterium]